MQDFRTMAAMGGCGGVGIFSGDRRMRPHPGQAIKCPRCESLNTKFCYYNNYNLSQPRHFCKSCRRYWTKGGVLRNVPVGGGCRKAKRPKSKSSPDRPSRHDDRNGDQLTGSSSSSNPPPAKASAYAAEASGSLASGVAPFGDIDPNSLPATGMAECLDFPLANSFTSLTTAAMNSTGIGFSGAADPICAQRQKQNGGDDGKNDINVNSGQNEKYAGETETVGLQAWQLQGQLGKEGELAGLEWPANCGGDPGLFELAATLEQGYHSWGNQAQTHWSEMDQSLYLP